MKIVEAVSLVVSLVVSLAVSLSLMCLLPESG
jgi:hypothetical protein